ncbi:MAG UNVERIFIED_CONTAM: hypothetical protein LVR29_27080 [Microcystis novacekii LVE1205-3]
MQALAAINVTEKRGCEYFAAHIYALKAGEQTPENLENSGNDRQNLS